MTRAPSGGVTAPVAPRVAMTPSLMTIVCPSRNGPPVPSMTTALVSTTTGASTLTYAERTCCESSCGAAAIAAERAITTIARVCIGGRLSHEGPPSLFELRRGKPMAAVKTHQNRRHEVHEGREGH